MERLISQLCDDPLDPLMPDTHNGIEFCHARRLVSAGPIQAEPTEHLIAQVHREDLTRTLSEPDALQLTADRSQCLAHPGPDNGHGWRTTQTGVGPIGTPGVRPAAAALPPTGTAPVD